MRIISRKKLSKISKGYRLKLSTHKLIDKIQKILQCSQDEVITNACRKYYVDIKKRGNYKLGLLQNSSSDSGTADKSN